MANFGGELTTYDRDSNERVPYWLSLKEKIADTIKAIQENGYKYEQRLGYRDYGNIEIPTFFPRSFKPKHLSLDPGKAAKRFLNSDNYIRVLYNPSYRTTFFLVSLSTQAEETTIWNWMISGMVKILLPMEARVMTSFR